MECKTVSDLIDYLSELPPETPIDEDCSWVTVCRCTTFGGPNGVKTIDMVRFSEAD